MLYSLLHHRTLVVLASIAIISGCKDSVGNLRPAEVTQAQANVPEATAGTVLATPPTFTVKDQNGNVLGGVGVSLVVTAGGGTLTDAPTTSKSGPTPVGTWRLGNIAALNSITVTVANLPPLTISINGKPGAPSNIVFVSGTNQSAAAGSTLATSPVAQVRDQFGNGVPGVPVTFSVIDGDGTLSSTNPVTSDASGNAISPLWTLGRSAVPQSVRAETGSVSSTVSAIISTDYAIDLRLFGPQMPPNVVAMFHAAAARIRGAVVGDAPDIQFPLVNLESDCRVPGLPASFNEFVDDVVIYASVGPIDGANQILAFSFPCYVRLPSQQTLVGVMKFDSDDLDNMVAKGNLTDVIQHEMLHVVGIGTLWTRLSLLAGAGTNFSRYTGAFGVGGCVSMGGTPVCPGNIPVENTGGAGTADAHWRDAVFFNELMTGFVNSRLSVPIGIMNPLSIMSIQSLADAGYTVNPLAADPFAIPGIAASRASGQLNVDIPASPWEIVDRPLFEVSRTGTVKRIIVQ